jgi:hypothetical protein
VELKSALVITKLPFSQRVVIIKVIVKRLADEVLHDMLKAIVNSMFEDLPGNVNDAVLPHLPDIHHRTSVIFELGLAEGPTFLQGFPGQLYAYLGFK